MLKWCSHDVHFDLQGGKLGSIQRVEFSFFSVGFSTNEKMIVMPASTWFQQCEEWNLPGVSLQPMWFWILFSLIPIYNRMYITYVYMQHVYNMYIYTYMGCENSISIYKEGHLPTQHCYCHPLGFPASLDLSGEPSRCLSGARWHPDGCISCCLLLSRIWVEIDQFKAPRINKPYMKRHGRHRFSWPLWKHFGILVDCLVASVGTPCSPVGFSTHLAGKISTSWSRSRLWSQNFARKKL